MAEKTPVVWQIDSQQQLLLKLVDSDPVFQQHLQWLSFYPPTQSFLVILCITECLSRTKGNKCCSSSILRLFRL